MKNHKQIQEKFDHDGFYIAKNIVKENQIKKILDTFCKVYFKNNPSSNFIKKNGTTEVKINIKDGDKKLVFKLKNKRFVDRKSVNTLKKQDILTTIH